MDKKYKICLILMQCFIAFLFTLNMSFAQDNSVFVKNPVLVLSGNAGDGEGEFGSVGQGDGYGPMDFALDNNNNIWIMDVMNRRVQKFDQNGNFILEFPNEKNPSPIKLGTRYVECDPSGNILMGPLSKGEIVIINNNGEYLRTIKLPNVKYEIFDFAVNNLGELVYYHNNETIILDTDTGEVIRKIKDGPIILGNTSPFSTSVIGTSPTGKRIIIDSDLKKPKEYILPAPQINDGYQNSHIFFVDPFGNLFVKTIVSGIGWTKEQYISYYTKEGNLIKELPQTRRQAVRETLGWTVHNIDKDGNFYRMEISLDRRLAQEPEEESRPIYTDDPILYIWKWERH